MNWKSHAHQLVIFSGFAFLVVFWGQMTLAIPGANGVESNFAEVALMLSIPFLPRFYLALLLPFFTYFNALPEPSHFPEVINHIVSFPIVWLAYKWSKSFKTPPMFVLFWVLVIFAYYFIGLIPIVFIGQFAMGLIEIHDIVPQTWSVSKYVIYEFMVTTFVATFYFLMIRELGIRKIAQEALLKKNEEISHQKSLLQAQYDATQEGILVVSQAGQMVSWNKRFLEIWRIPPEITAKGVDAAALEHVAAEVENPRTFLSLVQELYANKSDSRQDLLRLKDGRSIDRFTAPIRGENDEFFGRVWFFRDVSALENALTERSNLQKQLYQSQKMEAVGQLAGGVAHDFNNSLAAIIGATDLAMMDDVPLAERNEYLAMIQTAAKRAGDLTKKLLTFSRKGTKEMALLDTAAVVKETVALLKHTVDKRINILVDKRTDDTLIVGDDGLLQNAFMNLGINASHAMPQGGTLTYTLDEIELAEEYCEASPFELTPGTHLSISVRDTGCGMSPEVQSRIFEPFFTTKKEGEGTGLGLAAVYGTIQDHHGAITVYSEVGTGTVFHVYLPTSRNGVVAGAKTEHTTKTGVGTILLVDDEEPIRITARAMLTKSGYNVILAANGQEAVETVRAQRGGIDLVILDMIMPVMGGREAFSRIREMDPTLPVLVASGFSKETELRSMKEMGITGYLEKPFGRIALLEAVSNAFMPSRG